MKEQQTVTLTGPDNLIAHIEGLQATISKRNEQIEALQERVRKLENGEPQQGAVKKAYRRGWEECAGRLMNITRDTQDQLARAYRAAFDEYLAADRQEEA